MGIVSTNLMRKSQETFSGNLKHLFGPLALRAVYL